MPAAPRDPPPRAARAAAPGRVGWWVWAFGALFLVSVGTGLMRVLNHAPMARLLDGERSSLRRLAPPADGTEARVMVVNLPSDGQVRAVAQPPERAGERWRVVIEWTAEPASREPAPGNERLMTVLLPNVDEVDVVDRRGRVPEVLTLKADPLPASVLGPGPADAK